MRGWYQARVVGVAADEDLRARDERALRPGAELVERDGTERLLGEPEEDGARPLQVLVLPGDLDLGHGAVHHLEVGATRVVEDEIGAARLENRANSLLPVGAVGDATGQEDGQALAVMPEGDEPARMEIPWAERGPESKQVGDIETRCDS